MYVSVITQAVIIWKSITEKNRKTQCLNSIKNVLKCHFLYAENIVDNNFCSLLHYMYCYLLNKKSEEITILEIRPSLYNTYEHFTLFLFRYISM